MTSDLDINRSANLLAKQHREDAPTHAAMRADAMLEKGDVEGYAVWKRILRAVGELRRERPRGGPCPSLSGPALVADYFLF